MSGCFGKSVDRLCCTIRLAGHPASFVPSTARITRPLQERPHHDRQLRHDLRNPGPRPGLDPRSFRRPARSPPRTGTNPPTRRDRLHGHLRRVLRRRYLGTDRGLCSLQDRLAPDRPHLARRRPLARHLPTGLLSARLARLSEVLLLLDDRADAAAGIDSRRRGFARTDADRHRRQGPTRLGAATPSANRPSMSSAPGRSRII